MNNKKHSKHMDFHRFTAIGTTLVFCTLLYLNLRTCAGWPIDIHRKELLVYNGGNWITERCDTIDLDFLLADLVIGMILWSIAFVICEFFEYRLESHTMANRNAAPPNQFGDSWDGRASL